MWTVLEQDHCYSDYLISRGPVLTSFHLREEEAETATFRQTEYGQLWMSLWSGDEILRHSGFPAGMEVVAIILRDFQRPHIFTLT